MSIKKLITSGPDPHVHYFLSQSLGHGNISTAKLPLQLYGSRRASYQLLVKEWALNTSKLPPGGLPWNSVLK